MTRALLDINVLIALLDQDHVDHQRAREWFATEIIHGWASCAVTQNGFVRIISQPRYPSPISPSQAMTLLANATRTKHHEFWACRTSLLDEQTVDPNRIHGPSQVTDAYLLALAAAHGGRFVTFDQRIAIEVAPSAGEENLTIL